MRFTSIICLTLSILGCSQNSPQRSPTMPTPVVTTPPPQPTPRPQPPSTKIGLVGHVVTPSGECIEGATVEVVGGEGLVGQKVAQRTPCDPVRSAGGFVINIDKVFFGSLPITVRASAPGWHSQERTMDYTLEATRITLVPTGL